MTDDEVMRLWTDHGLMTEGLGSPIECDPSSPATQRERHADFWGVVGMILQDAYTEEGEDRDDIPWWMRESVTQRLANN